MLSASGPPSRRPMLLRQALRELEASGDRLGLACAWTELAQVLQERGEDRQVSMITGRVQLLLAEMGIESVQHLDLAVHRFGAGDGGDLVGFADDDPHATDLSTAERRVAELAGRGLTNREIARDLHVTVSTVEQHLTHVFRKLDVRRRTELAANLPDIPDPPDDA